MHCNLMNEEEFASLNLLKLKYRSGDQEIQSSYKIISPQKFDPPSVICRNFKSLRKILLNQAECIVI